MGTNRAVRDEQAIDIQLSPVRRRGGVESAVDARTRETIQRRSHEHFSHEGQFMCTALTFWEHADAGRWGLHPVLVVGATPQKFRGLPL